MMKYAKFVYDEIYGLIGIPAVCIGFTLTPEFQNLKLIRQNGLSHLVFPELSHSRLEHSIGVMHIAGLMCDAINRNGIIIESHTKELIQIAGLLHDIGHGAFSHFSEHFHDKRHEERSCDITRSINKWLNEDELQFVLDCITGEVPQGSAPYLYQIINNKLYGLDVDKLDYIVRDNNKLKRRHKLKIENLMNSVCIDSLGNIAFRNSRTVKIVFEERYSLFNEYYRASKVRELECAYYCIIKKLEQPDFTNDKTLKKQIESHPDYANIQSHVQCDNCKGYDMNEAIQTFPSY